MPSIERIYIAPVKSLALSRVDRATITPAGIAEDRRFFIVDERGKLFTQRECGGLVRIEAAYRAEPEHLALRFPDGTRVEGAVRPGTSASGSFFGHWDVRGDVVDGDFGPALSTFAGQPLRLLRTAAPGAAYDAAAISLCSTASVEAFERAAGIAGRDERRFRPNVYVSGVDAHGEDAWIGGALGVGGATLRVLKRDSRCVITTHDPGSGEHDVDSLKVIASYRTDQPKEANFGIYASVITPGEVAVGDSVAVLVQAAPPVST